MKNDLSWNYMMRYLFGIKKIFRDQNDLKQEITSQNDDSPKKPLKNGEYDIVAILEKCMKQWRKNDSLKKYSWIVVYLFRSTKIDFFEEWIFLLEIIVVRS